MDGIIVGLLSLSLFRVGCNVGQLVGGNVRSDGVDVCLIAFFDGCMLGILEEFSVGPKVGSFVGFKVGFLDKIVVGTNVGFSVTLGLVVGLSVDTVLGVDVGRPERNNDGTSLKIMLGLND